MQQAPYVFPVQLMGETNIYDDQIFCELYDKLLTTPASSVNSVFSDATTSHSTRPPKNGSQVAGCVANCFFL